MNFDGFGQEATTYAPVSVYDDMLELSESQQFPLVLSGLKFSDVVCAEDSTILKAYQQLHCC